MKKVIVPVLLLAVIIAMTAGSLYFQGETRKLHEEYGAMVRAAEERLSQAKADYAAIDPSTVEGAERQLESEQAIVSDALSRAEALEQENAELDAAIDEEQAALDAVSAQEDTAYYLEVYESLHKGMEKVEDCIEGN